MTPRYIVGVEKNYDWGDEITIRHYFGSPADRGTKIAELWFGTHPQGPSLLSGAIDDPIGSGQFHAIERAAGRATTLASVTGEMTMLVKLIACAQPLSLQTHPTKQQAEEGFAREEALGIPRDAPHRMYRDDSDKPEMIVALSRFEALCGFADIGESVELLTSMSWDAEAAVLRLSGIAEYMSWAFQQTEIPSLTRAPEWLQRLASLHPADPALRIAPLLNHVVLQPGQALSLPAGNLHAYLHGFGLEVMNSSDNVIRAGFTPKHVDVQELLRIVDTSTLSNPVVEMSIDGTFPSPSPLFTVGKLRTLSRFKDCHRIVCGHLGTWGDSRHLPKYPEVVLVEAGDLTEFPGGDAWVCIQH